MRGIVYGGHLRLESSLWGNFANMTYKIYACKTYLLAVPKMKLYTYKFHTENSIILSVVLNSKHFQLTVISFSSELLVWAEILESIDSARFKTEDGAWTPAIWQHSTGSLIHFSRSSSLDHSGIEQTLKICFWNLRIKYQ